MCAINPAHKKRIIFDVYTSDSEMSKEAFEELVLIKSLATEVRLNKDGRLRWHVKESKEEAA